MQGQSVSTTPTPTIYFILSNDTGNIPTLYYYYTPLISNIHLGCHFEGTDALSRFLSRILLPPIPYTYRNWLHTVHTLFSTKCCQCDTCAGLPFQELDLLQHCPVDSRQCVGFILLKLVVYGGVYKSEHCRYVVRSIRGNWIITSHLKL